MRGYTLVASLHLHNGVKSIRVFIITDHAETGRGLPRGDSSEPTSVVRATQRCGKIVWCWSALVSKVL